MQISDYWRSVPNPLAALPARDQTKGLGNKDAGWETFLPCPRSSDIVCRGFFERFLRGNSLLPFGIFYEVCSFHEIPSPVTTSWTHWSRSENKTEERENRVKWRKQISYMNWVTQWNIEACMSYLCRRCVGFERFCLFSVISLCLLP